jgi:hypothetical protein
MSVTKEMKVDTTLTSNETQIVAESKQASPREAGAPSGRPATENGPPAPENEGQVTQWFEDAFESLSEYDNKLKHSIVAKLTETEVQKRKHLEQIANERSVLVSRIDELATSLGKGRKRIRRNVNVLQDQKRNCTNSMRRLARDNDRLKRKIIGFETVRKRLHCKMLNMQWRRPSHFLLASLTHLGDGGKGNHRSYFDAKTEPSEVASCVTGHLRVYCNAKGTLQNVRAMQRVIVRNRREVVAQRHVQERLEGAMGQYEQEIESIDQLGHTLDERFGQAVMRYRRSNRLLTPSSRATQGQQTAASAETTRAESELRHFNLPPIADEMGGRYQNIKLKYLRSVNVQLNPDVSADALDLEDELASLFITRDAAEEAKQPPEAEGNDSMVVARRSSIGSEEHWITASEARIRRLASVDNNHPPTGEEQTSQPQVLKPKKSSQLSRAWKELRVVADGIEDAKISQQMAWQELEQVLERRERIVTKQVLPTVGPAPSESKPVTQATTGSDSSGSTDEQEQERRRSSLQARPRSPTFFETIKGFFSGNPT